MRNGFSSHFRLGPGHQEGRLEDLWDGETSRASSRLWLSREEGPDAAAVPGTPKAGLSPQSLGCPTKAWGVPPNARVSPPKPGVSLPRFGPPSCWGTLHTASSSTGADGDEPYFPSLAAQALWGKMLYLLLGTALDTLSYSDTQP